jgi:hypothetical protein
MANKINTNSRYTRLMNIPKQRQQQTTKSGGKMTIKYDKRAYSG